MILLHEQFATGRDREAPRSGSPSLVDREAPRSGSPSEPTERLFLVRGEDGLALRIGDETLPLPDGALARVMARYGKPLDPSLDLAFSESFDAGAGVLQRLRFRPRFDVIARDYLVYRAPSQEPLAELATTIAAALHHLARAHANHRPPLE